MAGSSVTFTEETYGTIKLVKAVIVTDDAAGTASGATTKAYSGQILECAIVPDTGDTAPTNLFDLTITEKNGLDVLCGQGADVAIATTITYLLADMGVVANSPLTVNVTSAGNSNGITLYLYVG